MSLKKIILLISIGLSFLFSVSFIALSEYNHYKYMPIRILNSVVAVENSSGVIIYGDDDLTLVLTAFHVVDSNKSSPIIIGVLYLGEDGQYTYDTFPVLDMDVDVENDLALLEIAPIKGIRAARIVKEDEEPVTGDDIYLAANPNMKFHSFKKGNLSSKFRYSRGSQNWEVSGGVIFGSSGGGAFTDEGKLFGVIVGVDVLQTDFCKESGKNKKCLFIPITDTGFVVPPFTIRNFILDSNFGSYFDYLRE